MSSKHRIGFDLEAPIKFLGMTKDELGLLFLGIIVYALSDNKLIGIIAMFFCVAAIIFIKKFKKATGGFRMGTLIWWHTGLSSGRSSLPPSSTRIIN